MTDLQIDGAQKILTAIRYAEPGPVREHLVRALQETISTPMNETELRKIIQTGVDVWDNNQKIRCIKWVRTMLGCNLKTAKEFVEESPNFPRRTFS